MAINGEICEGQSDYYILCKNKGEAIEWSDINMEAIPLEALPFDVGRLSQHDQAKFIAREKAHIERTNRTLTTEGADDMDASSEAIPVHSTPARQSSVKRPSNLEYNGHNINWFEDGDAIY